MSQKRVFMMCVSVRVSLLSGGKYAMFDLKSRLLPARRMCTETQWNLKNAMVKQRSTVPAVISW